MKRTKAPLEKLFDRLHRESSLKSDQINRQANHISTQESLLDTLRSRYDEVVKDQESSKAKIESQDQIIKTYQVRVDDLLWDIKRLTQQRDDALLFAIQMMHGKSRDMQTVIRKTQATDESNVQEMQALLNEVKLAV